MAGVSAFSRANVETFNMNQANEKIRVGIVGLGHRWRARHLPALRSLADRFDVRAVFDAVYQLAVNAAEEFGAEPVGGIEPLLAREDVDAVLILATGWHGFYPLLASRRAEKPLYYGGPLGILGRCKQEIGNDIVDYPRFMAELPRRWTPGTIRLKELIATTLGRPKLLFCHQRRGAENEAAEENGGDAERGRELIEMVDWCCYVVGESPRSVIGVQHQIGSEPGPIEVPAHDAFDYQSLTLDFSSPDSPGTQTVAQISFGQYFPSSWQEAINYRPLADLQIACENGVAFVDLPSTLVWFDSFGRHQESLDSERPVGEQLLLRFHQSILHREHHLSDWAEVRRALEILCGASRSHQNGCRIELPLT